MDHPSVILLGADNEIKLRKQFEQIQKLGFVCKPFFEADLNYQMTSFATEPISGSDRLHFKKYQLIKSADMARCLIGGVA